MKLIDQIDIKQLTNSYLFANTPMYLYRHFRRNISIKELAENNPPQKLASEYKELISKKLKSINDIVIAYSILIAVTFLEYQQALEVFDTIDVSKLDWGNDIKDIYTSRTKSTNIVELYLEPRISQAKKIKSDSSTSEFLLNIPQTSTYGGHYDKIKSNALCRGHNQRYRNK